MLLLLFQNNCEEMTILETIFLLQELNKKHSLAVILGEIVRNTI
jgi:hypothetical protein